MNKVIQIRGSERPKEIDNFEVVKAVKYLGIRLGRGRDIFREEKRRWLKNAQTLAAPLMAQIKKSYDKVTWIRPYGNRSWPQQKVMEIIVQM